MQKIVAVLPWIVGLGIGYLAVNPPESLPLDGPARWVLFSALLALVLLGFFALLLSLGLPARLELTAVPDERLDPSVTEVVEAYEELGFRKIGPPLRASMQPPALLVPLLGPDGRTYATVFRTGTVPPKTAWDVVSVFEPQGGLTTGPFPEGAALPAGPRSFFQVLPRAGVADLYRGHLEALRFLESHGLRAKRVSAQDFAADIQRGVAEQRKQFLRNPLRAVLTVMWRAASKKTPHLGPVQQQAIARQALR